MGAFRLRFIGVMENRITNEAKFLDRDGAKDFAFEMIVELIISDGDKCWCWKVKRVMEDSDGGCYLCVNPSRDGSKETSVWGNTIVLTAFTSFEKAVLLCLHINHSIHEANHKRDNKGKHIQRRRDDSAY